MSFMIGIILAALTGGFVGWLLPTPLIPSPLGLLVEGSIAATAGYVAVFVWEKWRAR